jgi:CheY-like chemotaxis protein
MGKKILLADDSITIQKVIELTFSDEDFDVITVGNGRLALEKLPEVRPDIVLCDIIMPEKDGYEVCEQIKKDPATSHVPVLLLTGAFEPFDQERAARAGYDGSLAKPFEPETLIAKVKDLLARAPARASAPPTVPVVRPVDMPRPSAAVAPPPVLPFQRPAPVVFAPSPPPTTAPPAPSFIPDEPFGGLDEAAFTEPATESEGPFAPVTEEESATLLAPPAPAPADASSTVMFRGGELPWTAPPAPPVPAAPVATDREPPPVPAPGPEAADVPELAEEPAFEEVLEEDLDFGDGGFEPAPEVESSTVMFTPGVATLPPVPADDEGGVTGAFEPVRVGEAPPPLERDLPPAFEPEPEPLEPVPQAEEFPAPMPEPVEEEAPPLPEPAPAPPLAAESFADLASEVIAPPPPAPPSEAAAMSVPVEMVEKIAQRVVAQISEKSVREIAWEVIPDLAEALIKQEIERLKAELQKI